MDARSIILDGRMGRRQVAAVALCVFLNGLDGFDVLSVSFASPGIAREWGVDRAALGVVLSMELIGMAIGSVLLGMVADRIGRRPPTLGCLAAMATGMMLAGTAHDVASLAAFRLLTGLGIGGMLATINASVAELSSARRRDLAVSLMSSGYPLGAVIGGVAASALLVAHDWRTVFQLGAVVTAACLPLAAWLLPESVEYLAGSDHRDALARINRTLRTFGHPPAAELIATRARRPAFAIGRLWSRALAPVTARLTIGYFAHIMTFYFLVKWIPKVVVDMGFAPSAAGGVLVWANVGGAAGALLFSALGARADLRRLTVVFLLLSAASIALLGRSGAQLGELSFLAALAGFCTNAAIIGFYALLARGYPADLRAGGTGFVIGIGRGGAALGPIAAGLLFAAGWGLPAVALGMAAGPLIGAAALHGLRRGAGDISPPASSNLD